MVGHVLELDDEAGAGAGHEAGQQHQAGQHQHTGPGADSCKDGGRERNDGENVFLIVVDISILYLQFYISS